MTYGARQIAATLIVCAVCQRAYYMTHVEKLCLTCRRKDRSA